MLPLLTIWSLSFTLSVHIVQTDLFYLFQDNIAELAGVQTAVISDHLTLLSLQSLGLSMTHSDKADDLIKLFLFPHWSPMHMVSPSRSLSHKDSRCQHHGGVMLGSSLLRHLLRMAKLPYDLTDSQDGMSYMIIETR